MAKRRRISARQRAAREADRRAAAAVRLAGARLPRSHRHSRSHDAAVELSQPARAVGGGPAGDGVALSVCASGCQVCAEASERFAAVRAASLVQRRRLDEPDRYPYAAGKHTLHRSSCRQIQQRVGTVGDDDSMRMRGALTRFAHDGAFGSGWATHMRMMEPGEAAAWVKERTGPRGGTHYRLCGICTPVLPETG
ncbi:predicted protein [Streptomyces viridosporus ATCC 14672]|uniref:Predicted protein n=1 Tax=Streptomyces viridosporus (strain ATCC 14672 / DSM 40746 / JCM 4963 / KCTC 9882 / NRRL B-12104 / FH 1290) TaxID=566461 RepID=D5ZVP1_STRV1|nr:predicted protein [Streptomyces viridosporus ATCC 14672]